MRRLLGVLRSEQHEALTAPQPGLADLAGNWLPASSEGSPTWFPDEGIDLERHIEGVELTLIKRSLERTQGNKVQAARLLNLKRTTLIEKLKRLERAAPSL